MKDKKSKGPSAYWGSLTGWKAVDVGDDILLGAEEGGFAGLEILEDPASIIDPSFLKVSSPGRHRQTQCTPTVSSRQAGPLWQQANGACPWHGLYGDNVFCMPRPHVGRVIGHNTLSLASKPSV